MEANEEGESFFPTKLFGQETKRTCERIWRCLKKDKVTSIGIYGVKGVGKTTLAKLINHLLEQKTKSQVFWINVSQQCNIKGLQNDVAKALGLDLLEEHDEDKRGIALHESFKEKKDFVLVLDDVLEDVPLKMLGNPLKIEGGRLIVTSCLLETCRKMGCQRKFGLNTLEAEESWSLFIEKLGNETIIPQEVEGIVKSLVNNSTCGLPLGIITIATKLKELELDNVDEWKKALESITFQESFKGENNDVIKMLLYSFNSLKEQKLQQCFLYCCLYPEDEKIPKDQLISRFVLEGLIDEQETREAEFEEGSQILNRLEGVCLLESGILDSEGNQCVKMHNLIRDMALRITNENPVFMVKAGVQLNDAPKEDEWMENLDKVSLMRNQMAEIPEGTSAKCPRLTTLMLQQNYHLWKIPDSFFEHMKALRVLDLSHTCIEKLPDSVSDLENLTALLVAFCWNLRSIPTLQKLMSLQELDLSGTGIQTLPESLEALWSLKCLNMYAMRCLEKIPIGIFPQLSTLQRLVLSHHIDVQGEELEVLNELEEFQGRFSTVHDFNRFIRAQENEGCLAFYRILVGDYDDLGPMTQIQYNHGRILDKLVKCYGLGKEDEVLLLPQDIQHLKIESCNNFSSCLSDFLSCLYDSKDLKYFKVRWCNKLEYLMKVKEGQDPVLFPSLEHLDLFELPSFVGIFDECETSLSPSIPLVGTFSLLRMIRIERCHNVKKLLPIDLCSNLIHLERIYVLSCSQIEEIIGEENDGIVVLPKLTRISLWSLPELKSICNGKMICSSIKKVSIKECGKLRKLSFFFSHEEEFKIPSTLKEIAINSSDKDWWESLEWDHSSTRNELQPFVNYL
ncbi:probable disease resistance protein At4g27220 [Solanum dulcamara]|uniref:probable disease resistance protein At4g27220 n=1 Tax=Solanum dulcamara TaxID=45834 RepID=UPI002484F572|nr:probable disease resistance protein At4g27220 [Solanum dulcamara]